MIQNINKYLDIFVIHNNNTEEIAIWSCKVAKLVDDKDQKLWNDIHQKKGKNILPSRNIRPGFISKFPPILQAVSNWWKTEKNHYFHRKFRKGNKKYLAHFGSKNHNFLLFWICR